MLGCGSRMEVYPLVDELTVLRVPRRTEQQLIEEFGSSGRQVLADGHEVSSFTERELRDLEAVTSFIGAFQPDTTPFADLDLNGQFRYYSIQRRIRVVQDLRICASRLESATARHSLERFIRDVRDMVQHIGLLPDLAGRGNLVLDRFGTVKLIDINNFQRYVPDEELESSLPDDLSQSDLMAYALGHKDIRDVLPDDFLDDLGLPIGDLSLAALQALEVRGLGRDSGAADRDPFYEPLQNVQRRRVLALLRPDMV
jgi:hypothetical protein